MIGAVVMNDIVENIIVLNENQIGELSAALGAEIVDARPYGLAIGDLRTERGWTRNDGGEQIVLSLIEQEEQSEIAHQTMLEVMAILDGEVSA